VTLLEHEGRRVEANFPTVSGDDLLDDFVALITSLAARLDGRRNANRRSAQIQTLCRAG
jgi:predicted site-specific integrase-resolvase